MSAPNRSPATPPTSAPRTTVVVIRAKGAQGSGKSGLIENVIRPALAASGLMPRSGPGDHTLTVRLTEEQLYGLAKVHEFDLRPTRPSRAIPHQPSPTPPIADHIGLHYVLKMTNLARPDGLGTPNFLYLVGPFPDRASAGAWGSTPENNRTDSPLWQVVALGDFPGHLPLYAPDIATEVGVRAPVGASWSNPTITGASYATEH